jgi:hypothetical protein
LAKQVLADANTSHPDPTPLLTNPTAHHGHGTRLQPSRFPAHTFWTANAVVDPNSGAALEYSKLKISTEGAEWIQAAANEMGRLSQGV